MSRDAASLAVEEGWRAYPIAWRLIAGLLVAVSRAGLLLIAGGILAMDAPVLLDALLWMLTVVVLLPSVSAWLIERACVARVEIDAAELVVERRDLRIEIPYASIERVTPWAVPLPGPGLSLWMRSGRRLQYGLQAADPAPLLAALADTVNLATARAAARHSVIIYAHAKQRGVPWRWCHWLAKFIVFPLVPAAVWFNAHQHIAYGGPLGQYYLEGLGPYLKTFGISWALASIYLLLYASVWRAVAEGTTLLAAWVAPARAAQVRRFVEIMCRVVYYGGVPVLVLLPFMR